MAGKIMAERVRTIRPGEMTADDMDGVPHQIRPTATDRIERFEQVSVSSLIAEVGSAVTREAFDRLSKLDKESVKGTGALWVAVAALAVALIVLSSMFGIHVANGHLVSDRISRTERLVEWLVMCEQARQQGEKPPPLTIQVVQP